MKDITKWIAITIAVILLALAVTSVFATQDKVKICHRTNSQQNPYVENNPSKSGDVSGHDDHNGGVYPANPWGDIIPPFNYTPSWCNSGWCQNISSYVGQNWTQAGQAIYNNGCNMVVPTATPVPPTSTPVPTEVVPSPTVPQPTVIPCDGCCEKECEVTPTPTEEVTPTPTPTLEDTGGSSVGDAPLTNNTTGAPSCPNGKTVNLVANPHVWRNGSQATVNFFITEGDSANIYYREEGVNGWTHSVLQSEVKKYVNGDKYVSYTIYGLNPQLGYDFGIEQVNGCGGGQLLSVVVDGPQPRLFMFSYWEWLSL